MMIIKKKTMTMTVQIKTTTTMIVKTMTMTMMMMTKKRNDEIEARQHNYLECNKKLKDLFPLNYIIETKMHLVVGLHVLISLFSLCYCLFASILRIGYKII